MAYLRHGNGIGDRFCSVSGDAFDSMDGAPAMTDTLRDRLGALRDAPLSRYIGRDYDYSTQDDMTTAMGMARDLANAIFDAVETALAAQPAVMGEGAMRRLISECKAVLAFEHELREISVLGNTNVNAFKLRVEEAELALAAQPALGPNILKPCGCPKHQCFGKAIRGSGLFCEAISEEERLCAATQRAPVTTPGRDEVLEEVRVMLEEQRQECLDETSDTRLNRIRADELHTALINLRALAAAKEPRG